jgi:predicted ABC-type ATPase
VSLHLPRLQRGTPLSEQKPLLVVIAGPMAAGKTTFYRRPFERSLPTLMPPTFAVEDLVVDTELLKSARDAGYTTKVVFISTEDPNLNVGHILVRMSHGGQSVPLSTIPESHEQSMKGLLEARKHADDVLGYDNTPDGKDAGLWPASSRTN